MQETGAETMSALSHSGGNKKVLVVEENPEELQGGETTRFRAIVARANYLSRDRPGIQYCVKEVCRKMARSIVGDWQKLVRLGRYLKGVPRCVQTYDLARGRRHPDRSQR